MSTETSTRTDWKAQSERSLVSRAIGCLFSRPGTGMALMGVALVGVNIVSPRLASDTFVTHQHDGVMIAIFKIIFLFGLAFWAINGWHCQAYRRTKVRLLLGALAVSALLVSLSIPLGVPGGLPDRWLLYTGCAAAAVVGAGARGQARAVRNTLLAGAAGSLLCLAFVPSWAAQWGYPGYLPFRLSGLANHANSLAPLALCGLVALITAPFRSIFHNLGAAILLVTVIALAQSKTTLVCSALIAIGWGLQEVLLRCKRYGHVLVLIGALSAVAAACAWLILTVSRGEDPMAKLATEQITGDYTGRIAIWDYTLARWADHPWFGMGIGRLWDQSMRNDYASISPFSPGYSHNLYYQTLGESGWIGLIGLIIFLSACLRLAWTHRYPWIMVPAFAVLLIMRGITEVTWWTVPYSEVMLLGYLTIAMLLDEDVPPPRTEHP